MSLLIDLSYSHSIVKTRKKVVSWAESSFLLIMLVVFLVFFYGFLLKRALGGDITSIFITLFSAFFLDKLLITIHLLRKPQPHEHYSCDPKKVSILFATWNPDLAVLKETIEQAKTKVPANQIIVIVDKCQNQSEVYTFVKTLGVKVFRNKKRMQKAHSLCNGLKHVRTPYVLIMDDDTFIGEITVPTSLLDDGYAAVSFSLLPKSTGTLAVDFQVFEYRRAMVINKGLRCMEGTVANVSGAIGLYRKEDLLYQVGRHSGQCGGEDQQRTALTHLYSTAEKGVTFVNEEVYTMVPDTWKKLFKQRAFKWNRAVHENFWLFLRMVVSTKTAFLLKFDRAYQIFVLLTDPLRILNLLLLFFLIKAPDLITLGMLLLLSLLWQFWIYFKLGRKDKWYIVILYPLYSKFRRITRFIAHFWWLVAKSEYYFIYQWHKPVRKRKILIEYISTVLIIAGFWALTIIKFFF